MPTFVLYYPEKDKRWSVEAEGKRFLIGRSREAQVCIPHASVSKKHVLVEKKGERFIYRDLGSKNGVFLNGFRLDQGSLDDGDELRVGGLLIRFYSEKPLPPPPEADPGLVQPVAAPLAEPPGPSLEAPPAPAESPPPSLADLERALGGGDPAVDLRKTIVFDARAIPPASRTEADQELIPTLARVQRRVPKPQQAADEPSPPPQGPKRMSRTLMVLGAIGCVALGLLLGLLGARMRPGSEDAPAAEKPSAQTAAGAQAPAGEAADASANPLGPPAALGDPETASRLCVRLFLDLMGRPPLRRELKELREMSSLNHQNLWIAISSKAPSEPELPPEKISTWFERLMGRKPGEAEHKKILELAGGDAAHYAFQVGTSRDYASAAHRRKRSVEQLARSLLVDLRGLLPTRSEESTAAAALKAAKDSAATVARTISESSPASESGPPAGQQPGAWVEDTFARLLLRHPSPEESRTLSDRVRSDPQAWRTLLLELASRSEYRQY